MFLTIIQNSNSNKCFRIINENISGFLPIAKVLFSIMMIEHITVMSNGIENGADNLAEKYFLGKNLIRSTVLYCLVAAIIIVLFNMIAGQILQALA